MGDNNNKLGFAGKRVRLGNLSTVITKGTTPTSLGYEFQDEGIRFLKIESFDGDGNYVGKCAYISDECNEKLSRSKLEKDDVLFSIAGAIGRVAVVTQDLLPANTNQALAIIRIRREDVYIPYIKLILTSNIVKKQFERQKQGVAQLNLSLKNISDIEIPLCSYDDQIEAVKLFGKVQRLIEERRKQLDELDTLIKARFVELFGDLKSNSKNWNVLGFTDFAMIDTNMIHDFTRYENYPHIGIDSIEKKTGKLSGYRTVKEDGVISGKYLFTPEHIIYSKIRPNLNKVALPEFDGVCSADAYPILPIEGKSNKYFVAYTLRSDFFLDYILTFSNRTNLPKVNKQQVEGFKTPVPPIELQNQFATFVAQVNKSKVAVQKSLDELQILFDSLMQEYFG